MSYDVHGQRGALDYVTAFRLAALADGWTQEPTYKHEPVEHAAELKREGWVIQTIARPTKPRKAGGFTRSTASIHIWGPDGLAVRVPHAYDWESLQDGLRICSLCKKVEVNTVRVGFAGRVCEACLPEARRVAEKPGWTS